MEISEIGEFGLIDRITRDMPLRQPSTRKAVGDDAAIINYGPDRDTLVSTDLLVEGIHFDLTYVPLKHLGYKSIVVNLSDICAMNGTPRQVTVGLAVSSRFTVEHIEQLYAGMRLACEVYGVDLVGGDTTSSRSGLVIAVTVIGDCPADKAVRRSGAHDTDLICVSGDLGAAYMGLQLLEREKVASAGQKDFVPRFEGKEYLVERQLKPEARADIVALLAREGIEPTSMIDVSDGLSSELLHICKASDCGCRVYEERIPIDYQTAVMAEEIGMNLVTAALNGGEDYELLFTVPLHMHDKVSSLDGVHVIGHITKPELGCALVTRDGNEMQLRAQGFNHMAPAENSATAAPADPHNEETAK
ncbi:MAG: thiamine-phosphate kinase [Paramuribaculum sp.]|nr:thiamine-phosphate kinase [Paramuribaculum sp.]